VSPCGIVTVGRIVSGKLNAAMEACFEAEDAERTRLAYEVLLSKHRRGTSHVSDADMTAGEQRVAQAHCTIVVSSIGVAERDGVACGVPELKLP